MEFNKRDLRTFSMMGSRRAFFLKLTELAAKSDDVVILSADVSRGSGLEKFHAEYPEKFFNIGIAEQNMIGIAAGLAKTDLNVFATTFAIFLMTRCLDQIRINLGYMKFPIKLIGRGGGICAGNAGPTHFAVEDFAVMRAIPNITIVTPADALEAVKLAEAAVNFDKPLYIRLNDSVNVPIIYKDDYNFEIGKAVALQDGADVTIFSTGTMAAPALKAAKLLAEKNISAAVVNVHTIKPLDTEMIDKFSAGKKFIVSVEEHNKIGGLGSAIAEYISEKKSSPQLLKIALPDDFCKAGEYNYLLDKYGLTAEKICDTIEQKFLES